MLNLRNMSLKNNRFALEKKIYFEKKYISKNRNLRIFELNSTFNFYAIFSTTIQ